MVRLGSEGPLTPSKRNKADGQQGGLDAAVAVAVARFRHFTSNISLF
jgi:hypothetical protein